MSAGHTSARAAVRPERRAWLALGSNLGDRRAHLEHALRRLRAERELRVLAVSSWIETEPVGGPAGQGPYLNGALEVATRLDPRALLALCLAIEAERGRVRTGVACAARTLDIDLLIYEGERCDEPGLVLPHPRLEQRAFVLRPLAEIAPELCLPNSQRRPAEQLAELELHALGSRA